MILLSGSKFRLRGIKKLMPFTYQKIEVNGSEGLEITGYTGTAKKLQVPAKLDGLPVISIGKNAFTDQSKELQEVRLPDSILTIRAFSFYFCSNLRKLILSDGVENFYDGAIRTSSCIDNIEIYMHSERTELVHRMLEDCDRKMSVHFHFPENAAAGEAAHDNELRLIFPEYNSNSVEDTRAQTFHMHIEGSGFSFRECVRQDGLKLREYDSLLGKAFADDPDVSVEIAVSRLMYPYLLSEADAANYRSHIAKNLERAVRCAVLPENDGWIQLLTDEHLLDEAAVDLALMLAGDKKDAATVSLLMDYRHREFAQQPAAAAPLSLDELELDF